MVGLWVRGCHEEGQVGTRRHWRALTHRGEAGPGAPNSGPVDNREWWGLWQTGEPALHPEAQWNVATWKGGQVHVLPFFERGWASGFLC